MPVSSYTGWVRTIRNSGKIAFIELNTGIEFYPLQIVCKAESTKGFESISDITTGAAIEVEGKLVANVKQELKKELACSKLTILKKSDQDYPLQKKEHSMEFLREIAHLRPRTKTISAIMKVRNKLAYAIHNFFQDNDFMWVATPIITSNDCEGAGENFTLANIDKKPFFNSTASLTVSGQLNVEAFAQAYKNVYTFGPTFRAERSHTNRHIAEFWMVEPEVAFYDLAKLQVLIEKFIKFIAKYVSTKCKDEIDFLAKEKPIIKERLKSLISKPFQKVDYAKGIDILVDAIKSGHKFEDNDIFFGKDLASEHERYLCEQVYKGPIFLQNFPQEIKAFYMKENDSSKSYKGANIKGVSGKTVAANDLLVPGVGEIVGGSQREDDYNLLMKRVKDLKMDVSSIQWYLDLRKYGYYKSAGFGLGFERMIMYILDIENIRDTIPYPRVPGSLKF